MTDPLDATRRLLAYIDASPTPYHAADRSTSFLRERGFQRLGEGDAWHLAPGDRRFLVRGETTVAAFVVGSAPPAEAGFRLVGAHLDSPNLRLKPHPAACREGYLQLAVEVYGGVLLSTWTDRDLTVAGRLVLAGGETRLVNLRRPACRIPQLAIHLNREVNDKGLVLDRQTHLAPVAGLADAEEDAEARLLSALCDEADVERTEVAGFDLMLHDASPSTIAGLSSEFVHAPRLDNLASCHAALEALAEAADGGHGEATRVALLFDHEEVGSQSAGGAASSLLPTLLERIVAATGGGREDLHRGIARSLLVSADMAHAVHPNYADRHEPAHRPQLNAGPVIKVNASQRYATSGTTSAAFAALSREAGVEPQLFVNRSDLPCGSTIGPISAARSGIATVDVGNPMLSMHSAREMAGSRDHEPMIRVLRAHFG